MRLIPLSLMTGYLLAASTAFASGSHRSPSLVFASADKSLLFIDAGPKAQHRFFIVTGGTKVAEELRPVTLAEAGAEYTAQFADGMSVERLHGSVFHCAYGTSNQLELLEPSEGAEVVATLEFGEVN